MLKQLLVDILRRGPSRTLSARHGEDSPFAGSPAVAAGLMPLDDTNCLVKGRHGWFLANRNDVYLGRALIRYGEYGEIEHSFLSSLLSAGDVVVEVGANIGSHTVGLAKSVGASGMVIAIEPQPAIFRVLCANVALNGLHNIVLHACGCGEIRTTMIAPSIDYGAIGTHNSGGVSLEAEGAGVSVPVIPLDDLVADLSTLRLLKIDVEGMELAVLQGARGVIEKHRPLLYVENDRLEKSRALIEHLQSQRYAMWWHTPPLFNPNNYFWIQENDYPNVGSFNMLCVPEERVAAMAAVCSPLPPVTDAKDHPLAGGR